MTRCSRRRRSKYESERNRAHPIQRQDQGRVLRADIHGSPGMQVLNLCPNPFAATACRVISGAHRPSTPSGLAGCIATCVRAPLRTRSTASDTEAQTTTRRRCGAARGPTLQVVFRIHARPLASPEALAALESPAQAPLEASTRIGGRRALALAGVFAVRVAATSAGRRSQHSYPRF